MINCKSKTRAFQAVQWNGHNIQEIEDFLGTGMLIVEPELMAFFIDTNVGCINLTPGCYIIHNKIGDCYVLDKDFFEENFEME